jgi:hypothetical protein
VGALRRWGWLLCGLTSLLVLALPARSFIPQAERVEKATAEANKASGRAQALQLELTLRVAEREPIGTGVLVSHPTGLARLELRDAQGRIERHLLQGTEHSASRDGTEIESPRAFLPPVFLLQGDSTLALRSAMTSFGLDVEAIALAPCGEKVCYIVGDPARVPPPPPPSEEELEALAKAEMDAAEASGGVRPARDRRPPTGEDEEASAASEPGDPAEVATDEAAVDDASRGDSVHPPAIWIETERFEIVRVDSREGVTVEFGPVIVFGDVRFPSWLTVQEPGRDVVRLDFQQVVPVNAPAAVFKRSWLLWSPEAAGDAANPTPLP